MGNILQLKAITKKNYKMKFEDSGEEVNGHFMIRNLNIPYPGLVILKGKSGSGKSTLLNILGLMEFFDSDEKGNDIELYEPNGRRFELSKESVNYKTLYRKNSDLYQIRRNFFGFMFQSDHLIDSWSILENVAIPCWLNGRKTPRKKIDELLEKLSFYDLTDKVEESPVKLSGGMRQRFALVRALVSEPKVLFADEPFASLDLKNALKIARVLFNRATESSVILVLHDKDLMLLEDLMKNRDQWKNRLSEDDIEAIKDISRFYASLKYRNSYIEIDVANQVKKENLRLPVEVISEKGEVREENQDKAFTKQFRLDGRTAWLLGVADGMGGVAGGEIAAFLATEALGKADGNNVDEVWQCVLTAFDDANDAIALKIKEDSALRGMGTTLTVVLIYWADGKYEVKFAHIGDSRLYHFHSNQLEQITNDHNETGRLLRMKLINPEDVFGHHSSHIILRCINGKRDAPDTGRFEIHTGDYLLLSSDGLHDVVRDRVSKKSFTENSNPVEVANQLVRLALKAGSSDNITVVVYRHDAV